MRSYPLAIVPVPSTDITATSTAFISHLASDLDPEVNESLFTILNGVNVLSLL